MSHIKFREEFLNFTTNIECKKLSITEEEWSQNKDTIRCTFFIAWFMDNPVRLCLLDGDIEGNIYSMLPKLEDGRRLLIHSHDLLRIGFVSRVQYIYNFISEQTKGKSEGSCNFTFEFDKDEIPEAFLLAYRETGVVRHTEQKYISFNWLKEYMRNSRKKSKYKQYHRKFFSAEHFLYNIVSFMYNPVKHKKPVDSEESIEVKYNEENQSADTIEDDKKIGENLKSCFEREQIETRLIFPTKYPKDFPYSLDRDMIPDFVCLNFSMYETPKRFESNRKSKIKDGTGEYEGIEEEEEQGGYHGLDEEEWSEDKALQDLHKNTNAFVLSKWRNLFAYDDKKGKKNVKRKDEDNIYIMGIRSDDLQRSGLLSSVNEAMKIVTERMLSSSDPDAISYLFPPMCKNDVIFLKSYFSGKRSEISPLKIKRKFEIPKSIFSNNLCPETKSQQMERMKKFNDQVRDIKSNIAYTEHLQGLTKSEKHSIAEYSYKKTMECKNKKRLNSLLKKNSGFTSQSKMYLLNSSSHSETNEGDDDEDTEQDSDDSAIDRIMLFNQKNNKKRKRASQTITNDIDLSEAHRMENYLKYMRSIPGFSARFLKRSKEQIPNSIMDGYTNTPFINMNMFEYQFFKKEDKRKKIYELPRETYRIIPIWLFPIVLDVCQNDLLPSMIQESSLYGLCCTKIRDSISKMLEIYGSPYRKFMIKDTDKISPFSRLQYGTMLRYSLKLLEHASMWNDSFLKESIYDLRKQVMQSAKQINNLKISYNYRMKQMENELEAIKRKLNIPLSNEVGLGQMSMINGPKRARKLRQERYRYHHESSEEPIYLSTMDDSSCPSSLSMEDSRDSFTDNYHRSLQYSENSSHNNDEEFFHEEEQEEAEESEISEEYLKSTVYETQNNKEYEDNDSKTPFSLLFEM